MRVAQLGAVQVPLSITRRPTPEPGPGEILIKVTACGMCYSEVNLLNGEYPFARFRSSQGMKSPASWPRSVRA